MTMQPPHRVAPRTWTDEAEVEAISVLAQRKQRLGGIFLGLGFGASALCVMAAFLWASTITGAYHSLAGMGNPPHDVEVESRSNRRR